MENNRILSIQLQQILSGVVDMPELFKKTPSILAITLYHGF